MVILTESFEMKLREFHEKYGHYMAPNPTSQIPDGVKQLRIELIHEEYIELMEAIAKNDLPEIADACADLVYVVIGTAVSYGIPFDRVFLEVHNSNMTKTAARVSDHSQKYGTKAPKGPDYMAPQIGKILFTGERTDLETQKSPLPGNR